MLFLYFIINFVVSWFNAWSVGRGWNEAKAEGGWPRFMAWMGAVMSASGFTWCYLVILCTVGQALPGKYHLQERYAQAIFDIGYLMIILPVLGSGLAIMVQSWAHFWREKTFKNGAIAGWNSYAEIYDMYNAARAIPQIFDSLGSLFSGGSSKKSSSDDDDDGGVGGMVILLLIVAAVLCVIGGVLTTVAIVRSVAKNAGHEQYERLREATRQQQSV